MMRPGLRLMVGLRSAPRGGQIRGTVCEAAVEIWILVLGGRVLRLVTGHGNVELAHSRAGASDWEEKDGSGRLSVLESAPMSIA
jgi:hypothetical protein